MSVTWAEVRRHRLARHWLLERGAAKDLPRIATDVCGIHAQVMPAAEISFGVRADVTRTQVRDALWRKRSLVKTYGVRGTIHIFSAAEVRLWMAARRARSSLDEAWEAKRLADLGLSAARRDQLVEAMDAALAQGPLTLKELGVEVVRRTGAWAGETKGDYWVQGWPVWRIAISTAAQRDLLCFGPPKGQEVTFVRLDDWIGEGKRWDEAEALRVVFRRFLETYGPASPAEFNRWFLLPVRSAKQLAHEMRGQVSEITVEGRRLLTINSDFHEAAASEASTRLLPHFDCYLRGFYPREQLGGDHAKRAAGGTGQVPVLLVDGQVAGVWERRPKGSRLTMRVESFVPLRKRQVRDLEAEAQRIGKVLEKETELELGPVEVRAHL